MEMSFSLMKTPSRYPQLAETWNNTGNAFKNEGRYVDAVNCYDRAIDIDPKLAKAWYNKGLALQKLSREKEAQVAFIMAMELGHIAGHTIQT
jgi:tetratricopeptide (TPR) repeat protein